MPKTTLMETLCCITLFTYLGALTRMALGDISQITTTAFLPKFVDSFFLANIVGSFIMGVFVPLDKVFSPSYLSWYCGVTTGFCGSCTTFSTWQKVTADQLVDGHIVDGLMTLLFTYCTSYAALIFGKHIGDAVVNRPVQCWRDGEVAVATTNTTLGLSRYLWLLIVTLLVSAAIWTALFLDTTSESRRKWWVAVALGPIGSLARYFLLLNNRNRPTFPLFTFAVNVGASAISTVCLVVFERLSREDHEFLSTYDLWCNNGIGAGILGCFSTVSTFVNELRTLAGKSFSHAYRYGLLSIFVSQFLCVAIFCTKFL